jgi:GNAT superfamily N-acetyltransferase
VVVTPIREIPPGQTALAYPAMAALRPHVGGQRDFVALVDERLRPDGYRLAGAFDPDAGDEAAPAVAVAGFRLLHNLAWGRALYVDDLSTLAAARGRGHAGALMDWLLAESARLGCDELHLDSGVGPEREAAHRLYFNRGMRIAAHHFARGVPPGD